MVKKQLIMEKALELFADQGFTATSIQQITDRCGISKGSFYLSFKSKDELILGLIDYFISQIIVDIEQSVSENERSDQLLYNFYHTCFHAYEEHSSFAKILMKEQIASFNEELLGQMKRYNTFTNSILFTLVERQFPFVKETMRADLIFVIKGFIKHYLEIFLVSNFPVDIDALCQSLVEKTSIIAEHAKIEFITPEFLSFPDECTSPTKEQLVDLITQKLGEVANPVVHQSLELLKKELIEPGLPAAVIQGLLKNLQADPHSKWAAYLYGLHLKN